MLRNFSFIALYTICMENPSVNSFIPKSPVQASINPRGKRRVFIFSYVTAVFFFGTLLASVGIFIWGITMEKQLDTYKENLAIERNQFNQADLENIRELEGRMNTALGILNRHVSVHSILSALESTTLKTVQIVGFSYTKEIDDSLNLSLAISTADFNSALFQREIFSGDSILGAAITSSMLYVDPEPTELTGFLPANEVTYVMSKKILVSDVPYIPVTVNEDMTSIDIDLSEMSMPEEAEDVIQTTATSTSNQ